MKNDKKEWQRRAMEVIRREAEDTRDAANRVIAACDVALAGPKTFIEDEPAMEDALWAASPLKAKTR